jgi:hypothetical protein
VYSAIGAARFKVGKPRRCPDGEGERKSPGGEGGEGERKRTVCADTCGHARTDHSTRDGSSSGSNEGRETTSHDRPGPLRGKRLKAGKGAEVADLANRPQFTGEIGDLRELLMR